MKILSALSFILLAVAAAPARAQVSLDWSVMHATPGIDATKALAVDSAGNVYAAGVENADPTFSQGSAFVAAWNASGTPLWTRTFDSVLGHAEQPTEIAFDGAGGLYVVGGAHGATPDAFATFLLHLDAAGAITWSVEQRVTMNGIGAWMPSLVVDAQGRAIVGDRAPSGSGDLEITAYTPAGLVAWRTTYAGTAGGVDRVAELALAPNGEIVAIGTVNAPSFNSLTGMPVLVRLSPDGTVLQALEISLPAIPHGFGMDVETDAQGRIFVAATSTPGSWSLRQIVVLAFDAQGAFQWLQSIDGPVQVFAGGAWAFHLEIDAFGRAVVMGGRAQGYNGYQLVIAAYEANGTEAWRKTVNDVLGGPESETELFNTGTKLLLDESGEATVVGNYASAEVGNFTECDAFAFAVDAPGEKRFGFAYGFPETPGGSVDYGHAAAAGPRRSFVIAGQAQTAAGSTGSDAFIAHFTRTAVGFCYGDGLAVGCPCGNVSAPVERAGCASTLGVGGRLADLGASSVSNDTLALVATSMPNTLTLYFQGTLAQTGTAFGDGLLCASGTILRLGTAINVAGTSRYPEVGDLPISVRGQVGGPTTRVYQATYRNTATFCTSGTFNTTNGVEVARGGRNDEGSLIPVERAASTPVESHPVATSARGDQAVLGQIPRIPGTPGRSTLKTS